MTTLTTFLLARINEDEQAAHAATAGPWRWDETPRGDWGHQPPDLVTVAIERRSATLNDGSITEWEGPVGTVISSWGHDADGVSVDDEDKAHIARHNPARVLAECEAKRRIVELHQQWPVLVDERPEFALRADPLDDLIYRVTQQMAWLTTREYVARFGHEPPTSPVLRALVQPYADHPDYDPTWKEPA